MKQKINSKDDDTKQIQAALKRKKTKELLNRKNLKIECRKNGTPTPHQENRQQLRLKKTKN